MKIYNMQSDNGQPVANQFVCEHKGVTVFRSYAMVIAEKENGTTTLDPKWNCSNATTKYLCRFLGEGLKKKDIEKGIATGAYKVKNLNN